VLRKTLGYMRQEERGERNKPHNEELHNLYSSKNVKTFVVVFRVLTHCHSPENYNINMVIISGSTRARGKMDTKFQSTALERRDQLGDLDVDGRIISKRILKKQTASLCNKINLI
jgi:hypothetical protein